MRCLTTGILSLFAVAQLAVATWAQPPGGPQGMQRGRGGPAMGGHQGRRPEPPANPLVMALDANGDDEISAAEIKNAAALLKKLDKNKDGKLTADELMPVGPPGFGGPGQGAHAGPERGRGRRDGRRRDAGEGGAGEGGPHEGGPGGPGGPGRGPVEDLMKLDADKDGKITEKEWSEGTAGFFQKGDLDKDGALDREEVEKLVEQLRPQHEGPGGHDRARGDRPARGDRSAGGERSGRRQRPQRPE